MRVNDLLGPGAACLSLPPLQAHGAADEKAEPHVTICWPAPSLHLAWLMKGFGDDILPSNCRAGEIGYQRCWRNLRRREREQRDRISYGASHISLVSSPELA